MQKSEFELQKSEFEKRVGFGVTREEFDVIESYRDSLEVWKFAELWLREGGLQELFDVRMAKLVSLLEQIEEAKLRLVEIVALLKRR
jgi:hypothetical protein